MTGHNLSRQAGMSLIEVMLAVAITGTVLALIVPIFLSAGHAAAVQTCLDTADRQAARALTNLRKNLRYARVVGIATSPDMPAITFSQYLVIVSGRESGCVLPGKAARAFQSGPAHRPPAPRPSNPA